MKFSMNFSITLLAATSLLGAADAPKVNFVRDVAPVLNKAGCMSGVCHGAAKGKNGFKLSLRGYDPQFDYEALLYDLAGRRFNRADPGRSLMLTKPTQQVAHGGGLRFEINSDYAGCPLRRSRRRLREKPGRGAQRYFHGQTRWNCYGEDRCDVQRRWNPGRYEGSEHR
jgi:hypothetical protein